MAFDWNKQHLLAGNCTFTVIDGNDDWLTFRVKISTPAYIDPERKELGLRKPQYYAVALLTGPRNTRDFSGFGFMSKDDGSVKLFGATNLTYDTTAVKVADMVLTSIFAGTLANVPLRVDAPDRCVKCGKLLTVPVEGNPYRAYGYGPECGPRVMGELPDDGSIPPEQEEGGSLPDGDDWE